MQPTPAGVLIAGWLVREKRQLLGYNLVPFAERVGITFQYLSQIERGDRKTVSPQVFAQICDGLGISLEARITLVAGAAA